MKIEVMIYIYGAICISMIGFNTVYNLLLKGSEPRFLKRCVEIERNILAQLEKIERTGQLEEEHLDYLRRKLKRVNYLLAFNKVWEELINQNSALHKEYARQIRPAILHLAMIYREKEDINAGYFAYFLSRYTASEQMIIDSLQDILLDYVRKDNLYCRHNALKALYHFAEEEHIVEALKIADDDVVFLHEKLIVEGLLSFSGNHHRLIARLWEEFSSFSNHIQHAILNYIRFHSGEYALEMFEIMNDKKMEKELRLAAIRYFGKYFYEPAQEALIAFVKDKDPTHWEYATVAVGSLAKYPAEEVIDVLKEALHSSNWYVRYAAAQSLEHHDVDYSDIIDIAIGNDRYAREMIMYRLQSRRLQNAEG